jgi:7-cyano-7-deazaguanine synthase
MNKQNKHVVLSLSGGMDSSTLLLRCLKEYDTCTAISFDYGQKHRVELERAQSLVDYINDNPSRIFHTDHAPDGFEESYSLINYRVIKLDGLSDLLNSTLVEGGDEVPEGHYAEENMKSTVVPNRNKIFASITQAIALSVTDKTGENCDIALGIHSGDHAVYPDTTEEFRQADMHAFRIGNWGSEKVGFFTPYMEGDKFSILQDGVKLCPELGLNFNEVYKRTNTSYKPIRLAVWEYTEDPSVKIFKHKWHSDYKSASSVERIEAFIKLGRPDPVDYADETGPVTWETARIYVEQVLSEYEKEQLNIN